MTTSKSTYSHLQCPSVTATGVWSSAPMQYMIVNSAATILEWSKRPMLSQWWMRLRKWRNMMLQKSYSSYSTNWLDWEKVVWPCSSLMASIDPTRLVYAIQTSNQKPQASWFSVEAIHPTIVLNWALFSAVPTCKLEQKGRTYSPQLLNRISLDLHLSLKMTQNKTNLVMMVVTIPNIATEWLVICNFQAR